MASNKQQSKSYCIDLNECYKKLVAKQPQLDEKIKNWRCIWNDNTNSVENEMNENDDLRTSLQSAQAIIKDLTHEKRKLILKLNAAQSRIVYLTNEKHQLEEKNSILINVFSSMVKSNNAIVKNISKSS